MLNKLWAGMILIGICFGAATGRMAEVSGAVLDSAKEAVSLCITMLGVVGAWSGIMKIAEDCGLLKCMEKGLRPVIYFLFPHIPEEHKSLEYITTNIVANILGLGWGATPAGIQAVEELEKLEEERREGNFKNITDKKYGRRREKGRIKAVPKGTASNEMCTFLILNISSLQLIPVNMIAYRSQYGSVNPAAIVGPAMIATIVSTIVAVVFCKIMAGKG